MRVRLDISRNQALLVLCGIAALLKETCDQPLSFAHREELVALVDSIVSQFGDKIRKHEAVEIIQRKLAEHDN